MLMRGARSGQSRNESEWRMFSHGFAFPMKGNRARGGSCLAKWREEGRWRTVGRKTGVGGYIDAQWGQRPKLRACFDLQGR